MTLLEFANPGGWWWAFLAIPIALLYILKIRLRRQPVSTLYFWDQLFDEKKPRSWWQKLRHLLSLLLQLVFLLLLVSALVDPLWHWQKSQQRRIVLILDNSASMEAIAEESETRLHKAKYSAGALVRSLRDGDRMAILSAGGRPHVIIGMTNHQRSLLSAIELLPATDGTTDVASAVAMGERILSDQEEKGEIIVITDGCFEDIEQLRSNDKVTLYGVGQQHNDNFGITRYQVRRSLLDAVGYQVLVDVANFSEEERSCRVELNLDDDLVDVIPFRLAPGETKTRILDYASASGGKLIATLDVDDALATDNSALAVLPKRTAIPVILVTESNLFLKSVLESIPLVDLRLVAVPPKSIPTNGILVLDRKVPSQLPRGRVLVVDPQNDCDLWTLGEPIPEPIVASVDAESPVTQHLRLDNVLFPDAHLLQFTADFVPLIQDPLDQPLLATLPRPSGDIIVLTCSLEKGDLPLRIAFPVLMKNTIEWFQGNSGDLLPAVSSGKMVSVDIPTLISTDTQEPIDITSKGQVEEPVLEGEDIAIVEQSDQEEKQNLVLLSPSQQAFPLTTANGQATIGPLLETGLWSIQPADTLDVDQENQHDSEVTSENDTDYISIACNLANAAESDLRPRSELTDIESLYLLSLGGHSLWFYLTLLATGLIVSEWWLYQRRIVG